MIDPETREKIVKLKKEGNTNSKIRKKRVLASQQLERSSKNQLKSQRCSSQSPTEIPSGKRKKTRSLNKGKHPTHRSQTSSLDQIRQFKTLGKRKKSSF
jgi:hypothetical protein